MMFLNGQLKTDDLVWKEGMIQWVYAGSVAELSAIFPPKIEKGE